MSRFDCIFVVRDNRTESHDKILANHIINLHQGNLNISDEKTEIPLDLLKKYIHYAKCKISPRMNDDAGNMV